MMIYICSNLIQVDNLLTPDPMNKSESGDEELLQTFTVQAFFIHPHD